MEKFAELCFVLPLAGATAIRHTTKYLQGLENFSQFGIIQTVIILLAIGNHSEVAHIQSAQPLVWHGNVPTLQML